MFLIHVGLDVANVDSAGVQSGAKGVLKSAWEAVAEWELQVLLRLAQAACLLLLRSGLVFRSLELVTCAGLLPHSRKGGEH